MEEKELTSGLCPHAFYVLYPFALALLYDSKKDSFKASCPEGKQFLMKRVKSLPEVIPPRLREAILNRIGGYEVVFEAVESCDTHKKGENFILNTRSPTVLCPASAHTILPFLLADMRIKVNCPDYEGIIYEIIH